MLHHLFKLHTKTHTYLVFMLLSGYEILVIQNMCKNNLHPMCILFTIIYFRKISVNSIHKKYER